MTSTFRTIRLHPAVVDCIMARYGTDVAQHGLSWVASWLIAYGQGIEIPETPAQGKSRGGKATKKGKLK